jgi:MFS family permease
MKRTFAALASPPFRWFVIGVTASGVGMWMLRMVQSLVALEVSGGSATVLGLTVTAQFLPVFLFSAYIGSLAERYSSTALLGTGQFVMVVAAATEGVLAITGHLEVFGSLLLAFCFGVGAAIDTPLRLTVIPDLVDRAHIGNAVGLNMLANQLSRLAGPAIAGYAIAATGNGSVFLIASLCIAVFCPILVVLAVRDARRRRSVAAAPRAESSIRSGLSYLRSRGDLIIVFIAVGVGGILGPNLPTIATLIVVDELRLGPTDVGLANTLLACGTIVGVLVSNRLRADRPRPTVVAALLVGVSGIACALAPTFAVFCALLVPAGGVALLMVSQSSTYLQLAVPHEYRARVTSLYAIVLIAGAPLVSPVIGLLADQLGARGSVVLLGAVIVVSMIVLMARPTALGSDAAGLDPRPA